MASENKSGAKPPQLGGYPIPETVTHPESSFRRFYKNDIEQSIPDRFEQQVCRYPDKVAVKTPGESLSYTQLNRAANKIARVILSLRPVSNEPVALLFDQGTLLIAAILGILKAGKIYVPLNPMESISLNTEVLRDSAANLILTDTSHYAQANNLAVQDIFVININEMDNNISAENIDLSISPDWLAYIFYTSGSTGRPKGVADTHRNVLHNIMRYTNTLRISAGDRLTLLQPTNFSGSVSSLFCALLNGAASHPFSLQQEGSGQLASWVNQEAITIWHSVPSIFRLIAAGTYRFPCLRIIRLEGDQTNPTDLKLYKKYFPDTCVLVNGLGATECGIVRQYFVNKKTSLPDSVVPIGYEVEDMEILLLNESKQQVEMGSLGEIAIRSRYLAPGYWRRPELTETVFRKDLEDESTRIFLTGDLGRMGDDGCLYYMGRRDFQQKLRGRWIDIPKIETVLHQMRAFKDVVVITRQDPGFDTRLVAYVSPGVSPVPGIDRIRQYLSQELPDHMIPSVFVMIKSIPLNPFGKVDRNALPAPKNIRPEITEPYAAPQTQLHGQLKQIWEDLLKVYPVGIRDNFFDLGGDSLLAIQLIAQIEKIFGKSLPLGSIYLAPTIDKLTGMIRSEGCPLPWTPLVPIQPHGNKHPFYFVHGHHGNVLGYRGLSYHLGLDLPVYGIQSQGLSGELVRAQSFEEMASHYIREIRTVQPHGPYYLGGWCLGGTLAMEMAQQLHTQGEIVALLVMIDAAHPQYPTYLPGSTQFCRQIYHAFYRFYYEVTSFLEVKRKARLNHIAKKVRGFLAILQISAEKVFIQIMAKFDLQTKHSLKYKLEALGEAHREAYRNYQPRPYPGRVLLFVTKKQPPGIYLDHSLGWSEIVTGKLEIKKISGHPRSIMTEPRVRLIAKQIRDCLE